LEVWATTREDRLCDMRLGLVVLATVQLQGQDGISCIDHRTAPRKRRWRACFPKASTYTAVATVVMQLIVEAAELTSKPQMKLCRLKLSERQQRK